VAEVTETQGPGDGRRLASECFTSSVDFVSVVGGDGTLNDVCQAYLDPQGQPQSGPPLALVPFGTGGDFRRTLALPTNLDAIVERIAKAVPRPIDLGIVELTSHDGSPSRRGFLNVASFGLGGLTAGIVNRGSKWMGGKAAFYLGVLRGLVAYQNVPVRITVDGSVWHEAPIVNVALANGRYFGGGMLVAPEARPDDGLLDVIAIGDLGKLGVVAQTPRIYAGTHVDLPSVSSTRGRQIEAVPLAPRSNVLLELDGETPGRLPLRARVAPGAVSFLF
jgi:diacylglycerol kinase (ATP)